ncbi:LOW QUALITY PROTEIN: uncharacterized protein Dyak_GE28052, partial [Drosophila yakuba]
MPLLPVNPDVVISLGHSHHLARWFYLFFLGQDLRSSPTFPISHFCTCRMAHTHMNANAAAAARTNAQPHCNHTRNTGRHPATWRQWVKLIRPGMEALFQPNSKTTEISLHFWFSLEFLQLSLPHFLISKIKAKCFGAFVLVFAFALCDVAYVAGESFGIGNGVNVNVDVAVAVEVAVALEVGMGIRS